MKIQILSENMTCVDLEKLLGLPVKQIETGEGVTLTLTAKESDITEDHISVLKEIYGGTEISLELEGDNLEKDK